MIPRKAVTNSFVVFMKSFDFSQKEVLKLFLIVAALILTLVGFLTLNLIDFNVWFYSLIQIKQMFIYSKELVLPSLEN